MAGGGEAKPLILAQADGYKGLAPLRELCGVQASSYQALLSKIERDATVQAGQQSNLYLSFSPVGDGKRLLSWTFTKPAHPAHPSVICRKMVQQPSGAWTLTTETQCGGTKARCDELQAEFTDLNQRMIRAIKQGSVR